MIMLTRLDGSEFFINPDLIETIEETPDTHIILMNGNRQLVLERALAVVEKIIAFKARIAHRSENCRKQKYLRRQVPACYCRFDSRPL